MISEGNLTLYCDAPSTEIILTIRNLHVTSLLTDWSHEMAYAWHANSYSISFFGMLSTGI